MLRLSVALLGAMLLARSALAATTTTAPALSPYERAEYATAESPIDRLVFAKLTAVGVQPANPCSDAVFLRRVYLDVIGTLPTLQEAKDFLQDAKPDKRSKLIDRLLERDEFADYWAMKWSDLLRVKAEFPIDLWPNAVQGYHRWIRTSIQENKPYDRFARELLTASGSNFRVPEVNFYRAVQNKTPTGLAQVVALTFMGERAENWPKERLAGMAGFFAQVGYKSTAEWKEEIVYFDISKPTPAGGTVFPDGTAARLTADRDPREIFADWLIDGKNARFNGAIVNRVWSWLLGRGIVHEVDDIRPDNPPSNPELLAYLEGELVAGKYDLKHIYRLILNSRTYQLASVPKTRTAASAANFAYYPLRRLEAEVVIDALDQISGTTEKYSSAIPEPYTFIPETQRSIALADGSISSSFLEMFGRSSRDTGWESERNNRATAAQRLHLLNSSQVQKKIEQGPAMRDLLQAARTPRDGINALYLTILSRYPTEDEMKKAEAYVPTAPARRREALVDLAWALINGSEFLYRH